MSKPTEIIVKNEFMTYSKSLDQQYWDAKWLSNQLGWDIGFASPAITEYLAQPLDKNTSFLIPGCGNAYEAQYLIDQGFSNITVLDISPVAVGLLKEKFAHAPQIKIVGGDFFQHRGKYDLIIEQTFFCALSPDKRQDYAEKAADLLNDGGEVVGVLFDRFFKNQGPPFGGDAEEYRTIFKPHFMIRKMEKCFNSIPQRAGSEVFIRLVKKDRDANVI